MPFIKPGFGKKYQFTPEMSKFLFPGFAGGLENI
jgi:hypothetical protein